MKTYNIKIDDNVFTVVTDKEISHFYWVTQLGLEAGHYLSNGHPTKEHAYKAMRDNLRRLDRKGIPAKGQVVEAVAA